MARDMTIGEAARQSGVKVQTIRFYEERGLLPPPPRSDGNQRLYTPAQAARLRFIRHARDLGFPLAEIADLLALSDRPNQSCAAADAIAGRQLVEVRRRIRQLTLLESELQRMVDQCRRGAIADCRVIESLGDHAQCSGDHDDASADLAQGPVPGLARRRVPAREAG
jgi:DNA-binding transcriptional MerR regulator